MEFNYGRTGGSGMWWARGTGGGCAPGCPRRVPTQNQRQEHDGQDGSAFSASEPWCSHFQLLDMHTGTSLKNMSSRGGSGLWRKSGGHKQSTLSLCFRHSRFVVTWGLRVTERGSCAPAGNAASSQTCRPSMCRAGFPHPVV